MEREYSRDIIKSHHLYIIGLPEESSLPYKNVRAGCSCSFSGVFWRGSLQFGVAKKSGYQMAR